ncbi:MAG: hypothetical protein CL424_19230 [Acidimicrobiaceae bacterium]|nr:hypothetical protein [Acidimicrobiaceae bacterium]
MTALAVAIAAAVGGVVRFGLAPLGRWGTLIVNVVGSFVLGVLLGWGPREEVLLVLGAGLCGSLTTFSTFALEASDGPWRQRVVGVAVTMVACLAAATIGYAIA